MLIAEIAMAHQVAQLQDGSPTIIPILLAYRGPLPYPLDIYLPPVQGIFWQEPKDTPRLIQEIIQAISGGGLSIDEQSIPDLSMTSKPLPLSPPFPFAQLEAPEGTMDPQSIFYVERASDDTALAAIERQGSTINIKAPRQMGKSSLLMRIVDAATRQGKRVALLDFQLLEKAALTDANTFFHQFCSWLTIELDVEDRSDDYWHVSLGNTQRCTHYVGRYLLPQLESPLVLAMDEVDTIFDTDFRSDFFGMLRSWHNIRAHTPIWKHLDMVLVTSTEPYQFVESPNKSPFNVATLIELTDFTLKQVADLNRRHGSPLSSNQEQELMMLLGGQPYLVRKALYLVASQRMSATELFMHAAEDNGPFGDHLHYHLFRLHGYEELIQGFSQIIKDQTCPDTQVFFRLQGMGLVRREGHSVFPRCQVYADYFLEHLRG
jgi:hypothetical protein